MKAITMLLAALLTIAVSARAAEPPPAPQEFLFTYSGSVTGLPPGTAARIWLPIPRNSAAQTASIEKRNLPAEPTIGDELKYHNQILSFEAMTGLTAPCRSLSRSASAEPKCAAAKPRPPAPSPRPPRR